MTDRPWSQMTPTDHLDKAEALTIEARSRVPAEAVAMRREAELHLFSAQVQALRLQTALPPIPQPEGGYPKWVQSQVNDRRRTVQQLERDALQDQIAEDTAAIRQDTRAIRYRT